MQYLTTSIKCTSMLYFQSTKEYYVINKLIDYYIVIII